MTHFTPSSWMLEQMMRRAMSACDSDIEQAKLAKEAHREARSLRAAVNEAKAKSHRARWGAR